MIIGFTGCREGMTYEQTKAILILLIQFSEDGIDRFRHGDCEGSDEMFYSICINKFCTVPITCHPPKNRKMRAFTRIRDIDELREPKDYIPRDHDIVDESDVMLATPKGFKEELRSGTWATIRYARKTNKLVVIIFPDGTLRE